MKRDELVQFVKAILRKRFPNNIEKQRLDDSNDRKLNFACPICGDSHKKSSKKRGNIYLDSGAYKCFNDGCMAYMPLSEFITKTSRENGIQLPSFITDVNYKPVDIKRTGNPLVRFLTSDTSNLLTISEIINRFNLKRLDISTENPNAISYINKRNLNIITDYGDFLYGDSSDSKILIFNFDKRSGKVLGLSIRHLSDTIERKYIIKSYSDLVNIFSQKDIKKDLIDDANYLNNYFNILNVNFSKPICLTEGQFDSLFINNCIATSGVSKAKSILSSLGAKNNMRILFDKDNAGKTEMMNLIKSGYSILLWNKIIYDLKKMCKTSSEMIKLKDLKDINDLITFLKNKQPNLTISDFNIWLNSYFSESPLDLAFL